MSNRTIFPDLSLFKSDVTEAFLVALREIYRNHPTYTFDDDEQVTKVLLYPSYGNVDVPGKTPKMVAKTGGYNFSLTDTLFNNMSGEAKNDAGVNAGFTYSKMMNTSVTVLVQAYAEEESSTLADELAMLAVFACRGMFSQVGLVIRGAQVSETDVIIKEEELYQTVVSLVLDVPWGGSIVTTSPPIDELVIDDIITDKTTGPFRTPPGIELYRQMRNGLKP